ncbi:MAG: hypothetical protein ACI9AF_001163, partial [Granulosicoccus sp.]
DQATKGELEHPEFVERAPGDATVLSVDDFASGLVAGGSTEQSDGVLARSLDFEVKVSGFRS